ncbi:MULTISPECIES: hypothetical protein [unclassified Mycobacterium]|uniref:hypothetical protein n=1 Tax=unclassified Mycobacterium TaxID=2642494 RepID=UPI000740403E|nr:MULTISPECIES: hypothetical protein [unclassified Mycobacterium]KUH85858.1 hypothetical protein AU186_21890 [Mycobacterium sp. GA-1999]KUH91714.1 hypothetical protein AU185_08955 [Mycobacterium sp. GA-0227b]KUH96571.1 hypothetical protein AU187_14890 [Mycobacterium sp. IS-1556]
MVAAATLQSEGAALAACGVAVVLILAGNVFRAAATLAVVSTAAAIVLASATPAVAALCGLSGAAYLVLRHTADVTAPTVIGALGFAAIGLAAVALPLELPWVPLLAPLAVLTAVVLATRPFWVGERRR